MGFRKKIIIGMGARPNFMKVMPLLRQLRRYRKIEPVLLHTGQHFDALMSDKFFKDLDIPKPRIYLDVRSGSHVQQIARIIRRSEEALVQLKPSLMVVVGDVNSTVALALVASKLSIPLAHVESGLRSFDRTMPEETNRIITDSLSDLLFTPSPDADENLLREGIAKDRIFLVGNIMIDALLLCREKARRCATFRNLGFEQKRYAVLTLHRPSNVDDKKTMGSILEALGEVQKNIPVVFPVHPRTAKMLNKNGFASILKKSRNFKLIKPLGYLDFLNLISYSLFVLTDSGGIQEETTFLKIPCLTLRENTERPITVDIGTNTVVGLCKDRIVRESLRILNGQGKQGKTPPLWDGRTAERITRIIAKKLGNCYENSINRTSICKAGRI